MRKRFVLFMILYLLCMPVNAAKNYTFSPVDNVFSVKSSSVNETVQTQTSKDVIEKTGRLGTPVISYKNSSKKNAQILENYVVPDASYSMDYTDIMNFPYLNSSVYSSGSLLGAAATLHRDPYIIYIEGKMYMMIADSKDNNFGVNNILGIEDDKTDLLATMRNLNRDNDRAKISAKELKDANVRLVLLKENGKLDIYNRQNDFSLDKVKYIDLNNLPLVLGNKFQDGTFAYFYLTAHGPDGKIKNYLGKVTYENEDKLKSYF